MFTKPMGDDAWRRLTARHPASACLLRILLRGGSETPWQLTEVGRQQLTQLSQAGISLRAGWPRPWGERLEHWLGKRLYLSFGGNFAQSVRFSSLVSSAVGRDARRLPQWPTLVDLAMRGIARQGERLLLVPGTTTYFWTLEMAQRAGVPRVTVEASQLPSVDAWLNAMVGELAAHGDVNPLRERLLASPMLEPVDANSDIPTQDKLAVGLSDCVTALSVRAGGNIFKLLQARLAEQLFPTGSVFVVLPTRCSSKSSPSETSDWLSRGAVGWYLLEHAQRPAAELLPCRQTGNPAAQQLCAALPEQWRRLGPNDSWQWLTHCTRGNSGPLPEESQESFRQRAWLAGQQTQGHPLLTLMRICQARALRGTARITRTAQRCISFSAVPLLELLSRRTFRPHLGRWDWEPYGLIVRQTALQALGAQPVLYRAEREYASLPHELKPFFQPSIAARAGAPSTARAPHDWSEEREWRLLGDLPLDSLPADALLFFVRTRPEALQLSRCSDWPVCWIES